ncbi:MAG: peptidylprolyl isomerase [Bacteroidaceae bacterium]|nr:peptidylprolyl isomerase [Bacteroidaceae bacterium]
MANEAENKYITVAYKLYVPMNGNAHEMVEEATEAHPFQIISGMGFALDAFEARILPLAKGEKFDFTLSIDEAYGPYVEEAVQRVPRDVFEIDGRLNTRYIYEGAVVPLMNGDGDRFNGTISEIGEKEITVDLNHPFAGKPLHFVGSVIENRLATTEEMQQLAERLAGGCEGCSGKCGECESGCGGCG